jgi:RNA polymerase sigma factor (sigma-70 family)
MDSAAQVPDSELLRQSLTRPESFGLIYERYAAAVFRHLARRVGATSAEDLLGDVFVTAFEARLRFRPHQSGSALPWLYGIAANVVRAHRRRAERISHGSDAEFVDWDAVDARVDGSAQRGALRAALASLSDGDRELLLLVAWEGLTPGEAAEALGISGVAARSRLHRARTRAQCALDRHPPLNRCADPRRI